MSSTQPNNTQAADAAQGTLFSSTSYEAGRGPIAIAAADLDGDGVPDLVVANRDSHDLGVLLGTASGEFEATVFHPAGVLPFAVNVADLDGDDVPDLVVLGGANPDREVRELFGNGDGSFQAPSSCRAPDLIRSRWPTSTATPSST